ncbi:response regulator [Roseomonas sp. E05]|uniref:response regulator transcription factor n=1 Tax=Roseomonas sp. E05 TaxID=3046310 RepID=UPI0024B8F49A|nr:response regulator [Roseomonas sp. E05]MDJ0388738.1 response regulator [Roseomonas sp. E05]
MDDDERVRVSLGGLIRSAGLQVSLFASGRALLRRNLSWFACVVTDVQMPGMSGLELQAVLNGRAPGLPLVIMTAFPDSNVRSQAMAAGARAVLEKPCDPEELMVLLEAILK